MSPTKLRKVAIIGGNRIPFCRSNTSYSNLTNLDMLADTMQGLVEKYNLHQQTIDEVYAGAVTTHAKDWNLAREAILSTTLSPNTPGITLQQACGTSLQATMIIASKVASGQIECGIAAGTDTTSDAPIVFKRKFAQRLIKLGKAKTFSQKLNTFKGFSFGELVPQPPSPGEPRTKLSMGQHCELMAKEWEISREAQDQFAFQSHQKTANAYNEGFFDDQVMPYEGVTRDNNLRADTTVEKLATLRTSFDKSEQGTLTAGNSSTLTDGAACVLLASYDWARKHKLPILAYLTYSQSAAIDFVGGDGLLMGPTLAVANMLNRAQLSLQDFDTYEIHEAFAAQVLCTLKAWESKDYCKTKLGLTKALGKIDPKKINLKGSSLAVGHPFAATGARVLLNLAQILEKENLTKGLISVCTAGGMGVSAILER